MKNYCLPYCFAIIAFSVEGYSQFDKQITEEQISSEKKMEVLDTITKLLIKNYIFPEMAEKMVLMLRQKQTNLSYIKTTSFIQFARMINRDLIDISSDKHILIRYIGNANNQLKPIQSAPVDTSYGISKVDILPGNIGYLKFNYFPPGSDEQARNKYGNVFTYFKSASAVIIDLIDNFGGNTQMEAYLCSYFFSGPPRHLWDGYYRPGDTIYKFYTEKDIDGIRHPDIPVYVLTSSGTFSAGEAFAYDLQAQKRAKIIGEITGGGAHATAAFDIGHGYMMRIPVTKITNAVTNSDWEGVGVKPDIKCIQYEALDLAYITALKEVASKTNDKNEKKLLLRLLNKQQMEEAKFIKANEKLKEYGGNYGIRKIIYSKGRIYYQRENEPLIPMEVSGKDLFVWGDNRTTIRYTRNKGGEITGFDIIRPNEIISVKKG